MVSLTLLAENTRTSVKAGIKRATKKARSAVRRLDADTQSLVDQAYRQAAEDISVILDRYAGPDGNLRIETLSDLREQIEARLGRLGADRNQLLNESLGRAAVLGATPFVGVGQPLSQVADDALRFVTSYVYEDGLQLSDRLWRLDNNAEEMVGSAVRSAVIQGHSASKAASEFLSRGAPVPADVQKKIGQSSADRVSRLASEQLLFADGNPRVAAMQVFRTEINRAHGEAYMLAAEDSPDFVGFRFLLSPRHPRVDICDMHAKVNRYGLGEGVYPSRERTPWPAHPNTLSFVEIVFNDEISDDDRKNKENRIDWLRKQPAGVQEAVLGSRKKRTALSQGLLRENEIATPWRTLKKKYERRGIDTSEWGRGNEQTLDDGLSPTGGSSTSIRFETQESARAASDWAMENNLADVVDYESIGADVANEWNRSIVEHLNDFPALRSGLQFVGTVQARNRYYYRYRVEKQAEKLKKFYPDLDESDRMALARKQVKRMRTPGNVWAYSTSTQPVTGVTVNSKWAKDTKTFIDSIKASVDSGFHPRGTEGIKSVIDHELGHELDRLLGIRQDDDVIAMYYDWIRRDPTGRELSRYARENVAEFVAEAWSEYRSEARIKRKIALEIGDLIVERYKESF